MFKNLLSKVGWGELPSSFGYTVGEKVELPFSWNWELHKGTKKSDSSPVSILICGKKDLDPAQAAAAKNAEQMSKSLRHPNILRSFQSIETDSAFYIVTEEAVPLLSWEGDENEPTVWGLHQALDGVSFLHNSGFTHGLVGPASIFVTPQGDYRLGSFELCQKGGDTGSIMSSRRRIGPTVPGWPDPPPSLASGGVPSIGIDMWGSALLTAYVFSSARNGRRADLRLDLRNAIQDIPQVLHRPFDELQNPKPLRGRSPIAEMIALPFFQQNASVQVNSFLASLQIKGDDEKDKFFESLPTLLEGIPSGIKTRQVLPALLAAHQFPGNQAAQVLPAILKIAVKLKEEEFREKVAPLVVQLFAAPDRAVRFRLLSSIGEMIDNLDEGMINDKIFPECVNGFTDSNGPIREATVKSMIFFVPRLRPKLVESRVVKLLTKTLQDQEASIRTNTVICVGRISSSLPKSCANQTLATVVATAIKDPFGPCRSAALNTLSACAGIFTPEELAQRMMPVVCHRLVDPEPAVAETAFAVLANLQQLLRQLIEDRRAATGNEAPSVQAPDTAPQGSAWGTWALSTVGSVVGQKIIGSIGPAASTPAVTATVSSQAPTSAPSQPSAPSGGGGMRLSSAKSAPAASSNTSANGYVHPGGSSLNLKSNDADAGNNLWEEFKDLPDADVSSTSPHHAGGEGWGVDEGDNFWKEFGEMPKPDSHEDLQAVNAAPAAPRVAAAQKPAVTKAQAVSSPVVSPSASTKPPAKSKAVNSKDDEDFWKEFDM